MGSRAITDGQISASTEYNASYVAFFARLRSTGSWVTEGINQWLQIDLITRQFISVTRVATQGSYDDDNWVIKYQLQYSNDTVNFQYYREQEQNTDKVHHPISVYIKFCGVYSLIV